MHGAGTPGFAKTSSNEQLDVLCLDLHVNGGRGANSGESVSKCRDGCAVSERELTELRRRELGDRLTCWPLRMPGVNDWIVVNHHDTVAGRVDVELYGVGTQLDGALKCGDRVLRMGLMRASMGDQLGGIAAWTCGQAFLSVVALCSMSAKL